MLTVALAPRTPTPGPGHEEDARPLSTLVEDNPEAFVGLYRDDAGAPVVVFGPGVDAEDWRDRLAAAAGNQRYRTETCSRGRQVLRAVQEEIASRKWRRRADTTPFGVWVDPSTCTVRIESDLLTPADVEALVGRFGTTISLDTTPGSHPELASE